MSLITARDILHNYGERDVLKGVGFALEAGDRVGLVGPNGEGKTTLLRIVGGLMQPTAGEVRRRRGLRIGYLPQSPPPPSGQTLRGSMLEVFAGLRRMQAEMDAAARQLADPAAGPKLLKRFGAMQQEFEGRGGYSYERRIDQVLTGLGFSPEQYDRPLAKLSGGQRARALLGRLLLEEPDVLLLDEPTHHLDLEALEFLERLLSGSGSTMLIVSHDRYFLDALTNRTWEVCSGALEAYRGNYSAYVGQRAHRYEQRLRTWRAQQEHVRRTEEFIQRYSAGQRAREARGRQRRLERFLKEEAIEKPRRHKRISIKLHPKARSGDVVVKMRDLLVGHEPGAPLLRLDSATLRRGQRVAVVGPNGAGKTTLLRTLLGELPPLAGSAEQGAAVIPGYLPQTHDALEADMTVLEAVLRAGGAELSTQQARTLLGGFGFSEEQALKTIGQLSGGQRSRVILADLAARGANLLVLDEPTNHLDIPSQEMLQQMLGQFAGTVLLVSHDRYLIDALAAAIWAIEGGSVHRIRGKWADYLEWRTRRAGGGERADQGADETARAAKALRAQARDRRKRTQRMQRRQERLEEEIHRLERQLAELSEAISQASVQQRPEEVNRLGQEYQQVEARLQQVSGEWAELTEALDES